MGNSSTKKAAPTEDKAFVPISESKSYHPDLKTSNPSFSFIKKTSASTFTAFKRPDPIAPKDTHLRLDYGKTPTSSSVSSNLASAASVNGLHSQKSLVLHNRDYSNNVRSSPITTKTLISRQTYPSYYTSYDALVSQRACRPVVGVGPLPIKPPPNAIESNLADEPYLNVPDSYKLWEASYSKIKIQPDNMEEFSTRISKNAEEYQKSNDYKAHKIKLDRIRETSKLFSGQESKKPPCTINSFLDVSDKLETWKKHDKKYFSSKPKRPELSPEMLEAIIAASKPYPTNEALVEVDGAQILRKDIYTLTGLNWLNDEIVNAYFHLLVTRGQKKGYKKVYSFNTFFYPKLRESGYSSIRRWTRRVDVFSYDFVLVPVHLGTHWCLASIDFTQKMISYYDSLGGHTNGCCDMLLDYLREELNDKKKQDFDDENWRLVDKYQEGIPQQRNSSDCGVFACTYAEHLTRKAKLDFSQEHMPYYRKKMIYEIITKEILE